MYSELQLLHVSAARKERHVLPAARAAVCCCHRELLYYQSKSEHFLIFFKLSLHVLSLSIPFPCPQEGVSCVVFNWKGSC